MNKKGFIDFDDVSPAMVILPIIGFAVAIFIAANDAFQAGPIWKLFIGLVGGAIGFGVAWYMGGGG